MNTRNETIADLLMGAAHADNELDGKELEAVKSLLAKVMGVDTVPEDMNERIAAFNPAGFDPVAAVQSLGLGDESEKRQLMELVSAVTEADDIHDFDEGDYIEKVARALELPRASISDLTVEVMSVENLQAAGKKLIKPPPPPKR